MKLKSMTGFGSAAGAGDTLQANAEIRAVNGRFLKLSIKSPPSLNSREPEIEALVKKYIQRGTVTLSIHLRHTEPERLVSINADVARAYQSEFRRLGLAEERIPMLPGVIGSSRPEALPDDEWKLVDRTVNEALRKLVSMREREGEALAAAVRQPLDRIEALCAEAAVRAPAVVEYYQTKLQQRVEALLQGTAAAGKLEPEHLAREVAIFSDGADITEEIDRLGAHLAQAREVVDAGGEVGRTLEFLAQEMHREVNTVGSKSSDTELSRTVISLKAEVARIKEQVANIE